MDLVMNCPLSLCDILGWIQIQRQILSYEEALLSMGAEAGISLGAESPGS
jgi:hypothetical protein